jgi:hypothetical protein
MNRHVFALGILVVASAVAAAAPAAAAPWQYHAEKSGYHVASVETDYALFEITCKAGEIEAGYYIDSYDLDTDLWAEDAAIMAVIIDGSSTVHWVESNLYDDDIEASIGFGGRAADELAHMAARAARTITVSFRLSERGKLGSVSYNKTNFSAAGSAAAIKAMYAACGVRF